MAAKAKKAGKMPQKKEEYITNKVLAVFSICLLGVLALMLLTRLTSVGSSYALGITLLKIVMGVSVVGIIVGAILVGHEHKNKVDTTYRLATGRNVIIVFAVALIMFALLYHFGAPIAKIFYVVLPALAVYYLIYHSYQPEFFVIAADCGIAALLLLLTRWVGGVWKWIAVIGMVVLCIVQLIEVAAVRKNKNHLKLGGKTFSFVFGKNAYLMMQLTPAVMAIVVVGGALLGPTASACALAAAGGYAFVTAVYYTVKLM